MVRLTGHANPHWPFRPPVEQEESRLSFHPPALAATLCAICHGSGRRRRSICPCVYRAIFRACLGRFRHCRVQANASISRVILGRRAAFSRPNEEFAADFVLVARRELRPDQFRIFKLRFFERASDTRISAETGLAAGEVNHAIYRIQRVLGRAFAETRPCALFPIDAYFGCQAELNYAVPAFGAWDAARSGTYNFGAHAPRA